MTTDSKDPPALTPAGVRFWRHVVLIGVLIMARPPRGASWEYAAGMWAGCFAITVAIALFISGLSYLFLTNAVRNRFWNLVIVVAWTVSVLQVLAWWELRDQNATPTAASQYFNPDN